MIKRLLILTALFVFIPVLACNVQSRYKTKSDLSADEQKKVEEMYNPPKKEPEKKLEPFLKDFEGPAMRVNGLDIDSADIRKLYEYYTTYRTDDAVTLKRDACSEWIKTYAVMSQWPDKIEPAKKKITELHDKALAGTDFSFLIVENSMEPGAAENAGDLGTFERGKMLPIFEMHAMTEKVDDISQPFPTIFGWHIIQVIERNVEDPAKPTMHVRHLLLFHGLDSANADLIRDNVTRWTNLAKVELIAPELNEILPGYAKPAPPAEIPIEQPVPGNP